MLIKDIKPIGKTGINLLSKKDSDNIIDEIIELPMRKACRVFKQKGIETIMSSANKNNILNNDEKPTEKEDVYGKELFLPCPTFEDAGKGYAWIMINFDTLSDENKDVFFSLENKVGKNGDKIGERLIWFVKSYSTLFHFDLFNYSEKKKQKHTDVDKRLKKFNKKSFVLTYNNGYPDRVIFVRMPLNQHTTVEEVEDFFNKIALNCKDQIEKKNEFKETEEEER